jgi:glycosyltransferase involved in cell wall biosynthesis
LFRDLIVLKAASQAEKGVILLKYAKTFSAVMAMLDMTRLMERYTFVLEPCWAGYCDPSLLMFINPDHSVFVQCFTEEDWRFVNNVGAPFVPLRLGPADWVNADLFTPTAGEKKYDLVMVANWGRHKRHRELFRALQQIPNRRFRVLLIGFPWGGRRADDVRREAARVTRDRVDLEILENLPARQVAEYVSRARAFVFLSRKEGDNKALVEGMFVNVPALVYDRSIGGAKGRINLSTGMLTSDEDLPARIVEILDRSTEFAPRSWALANSGSAIATRVLDDALRASAGAAGERYTYSIVEKTNAPNLCYKNPECRSQFVADYEFILSSRLRPVSLPAGAVAETH